MPFRHLRFILQCILFASTLLSAVAHAELTPIERATAEALFQEGVQLMDRGDYSRACEKFSGTLELEPGLGTMLHLADCYDKMGRTASSWALFEEVASRSQLAGDTTRHSIASARANELKARLSLVNIDVVDVESPRDLLKVTIGETLIPAAMWGSSIPLDPGQQRVTVAAEGYEPWTFSLVVAPGPSLRRVTVPPLKSKAVPKAAPATPTASRRSRSISTALPLAPAPYEEQPTSTPRVLGYVSGALGLVGLGVSGYFGYRAFQSQQRSLDSCRASNSNLCTTDGVNRREDAFEFAKIANVSAIAGGACLVLGTTLLIVSPSATNDRRSVTAGSINPFSASTFESPTVSVRRVW